MDDKFSIKSLLFTRAIEPYVLPIPTEGYKTYPCLDCGDKFLFQGSYDYHVTRRSVKITFNCRVCNKIAVFLNRCNLLSHIRSHVTKTATINLRDLNIEPLPLVAIDLPNNEIQKIIFRLNSTPTTNSTEVPNEYSECYECEKILWRPFPAARAKHFNTPTTNGTFTCPICLFELNNFCAMQAHIRLHKRVSPLFCPTCGIMLEISDTFYPFSHRCPSFKSMDLMTRIQCLQPNCDVMHPKLYTNHIKNVHMKAVYKCPQCVVACFTEEMLKNHMRMHHNKEYKIDKNVHVFYQCQFCPGRLVTTKQFAAHLKEHASNLNFVVICPRSGEVFKNVAHLLDHVKYSGNLKPLAIREKVVKKQKIIEEKRSLEIPNQPMYRVIKKCENCKNAIVYKCKYDKIASLPNNCPFTCIKSNLNTITPTPILEIDTTETVKCYICRQSVSIVWLELKKHFNENHKEAKLLDIKVSVINLNLNELRNKSGLSETIENVSVSADEPKKSKRKRRRKELKEYEFYQKTSRDTNFKATTSKAKKRKSSRSVKDGITESKKTKRFSVTIPVNNTSVPTKQNENETYHETVHNNTKLSISELKQIENDFNEPKTPSYDDDSNKLKRRGRKRKQRQVNELQPVKVFIDPLKKINESRLDFKCIKCGESCESKEQLQHHIKIHKDPLAAYQCMECGLCFVVKPSFSKHLFLAHGILDVEKYIEKAECYNEEALKSYDQIFESESTEPLRENQCKICRDQFNNEEELDKHFRVHGMAFLMTKKIKGSVIDVNALDSDNKQ